jgi:hypothetical protein
MVEKLRFFLTDVFGEQLYSGNQLATFLDAGRLSSDELRASDNAGSIQVSVGGMVIPIAEGWWG